ncbi:MAG: hypothetical protein QNL62_04030 [Gammaproteobacteria bacterium]|nr:hypothetical protein [Gammaproteobacteria bacterium]
MSLMVTQKKSHKKLAIKITDSSPLQPVLSFTPYINFGLIYDELMQSKRTRNLIMSLEDEKENKKFLFSDRDYISRKLIHEKRENLTAIQIRKLVSLTLKQLIPENKINEFKKQGLTINKISDYFMVHTEIVYMRLNLTE